MRAKTLSGPSGTPQGPDGPRGPAGPRDRAEGRLEVFHRVGVFIYTYFAAILLSFILFPLSFGFFLIDGLWQLATGGEGLADENRLAVWLMQVNEWRLHNLHYAQFGKGEFRWTASGM
jgi:hypothetical protein